jgi:hypothetical protein
MKKAAPLSAGLVAIKGTAALVPDMPARSAVVEAPPAKNEDAGTDPLPKSCGTNRPLTCTEISRTITVERGVHDATRGTTHGAH